MYYREKIFFSFTLFLVLTELADLNISHAKDTFQFSGNVTSSSSSSQFNVNSATAGSILFQGNGTAQFNNSIGTNNSFQVGSSTNLGVNGSASSTKNYTVESKSILNPESTTTIRQVIGTSAFNQLRETSLINAHRSKAFINAQEEASYVANLTMDRYFGSSYAEYLDMDNHSESVYRSEEEYQRAKKDAYETQYKNSMWDLFYGTDLVYGAQLNEAADTDIIAVKGIKGNFKTVETGSAQSAGSQSDWAKESDLSASAVAEAKYGISYESGTTYYSEGNARTFGSSTEWQAAYDREYNSEYSRSYAVAAAGASRSSDSSVEVNGIGSEANIAAASTSTFEVNINQGGIITTESVGTANGSAAMNLSTSSFANQSNASTASGFIQSFGGTTVKPKPTPSTIPYCGAVSAGVCWDRSTDTDYDEIEILSSPPTTESVGYEYLGSIFYDDSNMPAIGESIQNPYY